MTSSLPQVTHYKLQTEYAWSLIAVLLSAFIALFFSLQAGLFALLFALAAWWAWKNPEGGFLLLIVIAPILPMLKITQIIDTASLIKDVIIITLFFRTCAAPLLQQTLPYRRNILFTPILALVAWSVIETLRADSTILGILRLRDITLYILLFLAVLYLRHDKPIMINRLKWLLAILVVLLLLGGWQWFFAQDSAVLRFDPVREVWIPRLSSILAHPSIFGQYLVMATSLLWPLSLFASDRRIRIALMILFLITLPFIFLTYSRAAWLGFGAAVGVMGLLYFIRLARQRINKRELTRYALAAIAGSLVLLLFLARFTPAGPLLRSIVDPTYGSNEERVTFFVRLIAPTTNTEAVVGRGLGDVLEQNFRQVDLEAYDIATGASRSVQLTKNRTLVDNQYLKTFVEMGVVGLVLYGWIYWRLILAGLKLALKKSSSNIPIADDRSPIILGLFQLGFLAAFLVQAFFIDIWDIFPTNAAFWVTAAMTSWMTRST